MKKFTEDDLYRARRYSGGQTNADLFQKLVENQNELIELVQALRLQVYGGMKIEARNNTG